MGLVGVSCHSYWWASFSFCWKMALSLVSEGPVASLMCGSCIESWHNAMCFQLAKGHFFSPEDLDLLINIKHKAFKLFFACWCMWDESSRVFLGTVIMKCETDLRCVCRLECVHVCLCFLFFVFLQCNFPLATSKTKLCRVHIISRSQDRSRLQTDSLLPRLARAHSSHTQTLLNQSKECRA